MIEGHGLGFRMSVERCARTLIHRAGFRDHETPGPVRVARGLGLNVLEVPAEEVCGDGEVQGDTLLVREGLSAAGFAAAIVHELVEHHAYASRLRFGDVVAKERWCDSVAAAIIAPFEPFSRDALLVGPEFGALAISYGLTPTSAALRFGECTGRPIAVVAPQTVRVRGIPRSWGTAEELRWAAEVDPGELKRTRLCPERVVLRAA
jgi:hypothetical protein